jgi:DNA-binding beta-propeller fold protein YncE
MAPACAASLDSEHLIPQSSAAVRVPTLALLGSIVASFALAAACSAEHFPLPLTADSDGGVTVSEGGAGEAGEASLPALEGTPPAFIPPAARVSVASSPLVFDPVRGGVWTANGDVGSVSYADVDRYALVGEIPVGIDIRSVALSPDGKWLAAVDRGGASVALIDADARVVVRIIPTGTHPRAAVWDAADPRWLYVAVEDDNAIEVIDRTLGILSSTIPVGRLPSGVAVSSQRRELYVTHRIDGKVTIVPLTVDLDAGIQPAVEGGPATNDGDAGDEGGATGAPQGPLSAPYDVHLAYEVGDGTLTTPRGTPFGLESMAWATNGNVAWVPHELLAPTHPFQFQQVLFPTVSVVDLSQRIEVQTNPNDPNGIIAGRKNLFDAINVLDPTGNTEILSQPCAAAFHPNGYVAYVVACASEDLLTFDLTQGIAVDLVRGLPGDHPVGITLDTAGARAFLLADESENPAAPAAPLNSKSLHVLDLAGGSLLAHVTTVGTPITLVAKDPIDPDTRAGLRYFYRANSSKGEYATSGNFWLSCGGCHLDGFVSTNEAFFEDLIPADTTQDARIGHSGLLDFFSTIPAANASTDPPFNPHDVLSAFEEMGGLAPDRSGVVRTGQINPSAPPADATTMAAQVGKVFSATLPLGPTWLIPDTTKPNVSYDGAWCGQCHQAQYAAWQKSAHAHAAVDPMVRFCAAIEAKNNGNQYPRLCAGCHDPVSAEIGDTSLTSGRGITCLGCHDTERLIQAGGNADLQASAYDWTVSHKARASAALSTLTNPLFCGGCHEQFVPGTGMEALNTLHEWQGSAYAGGTGGAFAPDAGTAPSEDSGVAPAVTRCVDCHVPLGANGVADHSMVGGNVYMASEITNDATMTANVTANLKLAIAIDAKTVGGQVDVTVRNRGAGHSFPTGVTDIREPWVELQAVDGQGNIIAHYGGPAADGTIPPDAARLGIDVAAADGTILYLHELSKSTRIPFARLVPPLGSVDVLIAAPASLPAGATQLDAVLYYRNVRTTYFRAATGSGTATAPQVEVARVTVQ